MMRNILIAYLLILFLTTLKLSAQISNFPYNEGFESTFTTGINVEFIPNWTGNEVATSNRIFRDGTNQNTGTGALAVIPISTFTAQITVSLNFSNLSDAVADFMARSVQNGTGTRPALVHFSTSADGGNNYSTPVLIGSATAFPNATTPYASYSYQFPANANGATDVRLRITVAQSPDSSGTTARFVMDDFMISGISFSDTIAPTVTSVTVISPTQLDVKFSEPVSLTTAQNLSNYLVNNSIGNPQTALLDGSDPSLVHLTFTNSFMPGILYEITITNIEDLNGNAMNMVLSTFGIFTVQANDVIINEIMADPDPPVGLPNFEYIELYNKKNVPVDLTDWTITIGSTVRTFPAVSIPADSFLIVGTASAAAALQSYGPVASVFTSSTTLINAGTSLVLKDDSGNIINTVTYSDSWYQDPDKDDGGWSLELINPFNPCASGAFNWMASNDPSGGTPGRTNSVFENTPDVLPPVITSATVLSANAITLCFSEVVDTIGAVQLNNYNISGFGAPLSATAVSPAYSCVELVLPGNLDTAITYTISVSGVADCVGNFIAAGSQTTFIIGQSGEPFDVIINEIMADPDPPVGLPNFEYLELYNRSSKAVDMTGWTITIGTSTRTFGSQILLPDSFLIIGTATAAIDLQIYGQVAGILTSSTTLTNAGTTIVLKNASGTVIHSLTYSDTWYDNPDKRDGGWSLERIDPHFLCLNNGNWTASTDLAGGTPGKVNSVLGVFTDNTAPRLIRAAADDSTQVILTFSEPMDTLSLLNVSLYSINGIGDPLSVTIVAGGSQVILTLSQPILPGIVYEVEVATTLKDCSGNLIDRRIARFGLPEPVSYLDVVINEILFNPYTGGSDFVELYNRSGKIINLFTLMISNADLATKRAVSSDSYLLFPGDYVVLSANPDFIKNTYHTPNPDNFISLSLPTFANTSGTVIIWDDNNNKTDEFSYTDQMHFPLLTDVKGVSLERINPDRPSQDATNWHSASQNAGFATPAYRNSQYSDSPATADEMSIEPEIFSPDNDGFNDVANINFSFNSPGFVVTVTIYDARGRLVRNLAQNLLLGASETISWNGINEKNEKAAVGIYIVFAEAFNDAGETRKFKKTVVLATKFN